MAAAKTDVIHAYRHLYRGLLQAVQYSGPARFVARDQLRTSFREPGTAWNPEGVKRTLWFLQAATRERGAEHRILKNLLRVRALRLLMARHWKRSVHEKRHRNPKNRMIVEQETALRHYEMTIAMLNKTMGLCLR